VNLLRRFRARRDTDGGWTVIELTVVMAIMGIVGAALATIVGATTRVTASTGAHLDEANQGRIAVDVMSRVLRTAIRPQWVSTCSGSCSPNQAFVTATPTSLRFYADVDNAVMTSGTPNPAQVTGPKQIELYTQTTSSGDTQLVETILDPQGSASTGYTWPNPTCTPGTSGCAKRVVVLAHNVVTTSPLFTYYVRQASGITTMTTVPSTLVAYIDAIDINLVLKQSSYGGAPVSVQIGHVSMPNVDIAIDATASPTS